MIIINKSTDLISNNPKLFLLTDIVQVFKSELLEYVILHVFNTEKSLNYDSFVLTYYYPFSLLKGDYLSILQDRSKDLLDQDFETVDMFHNQISKQLIEFISEFDDIVLDDNEKARLIELEDKYGPQSD